MHKLLLFMIILTINSGIFSVRTLNLPSERSTPTVPAPAPTMP